jgi:two-component system chemotaxis response regulator CheY
MPCDITPPLPSTTLQPATKPLKVLYADDVRQLRELLTVILKRDGHESETVADGQEAWERLTQAGAAYDLLITDHHMPRLNGLDLVRRVRAHRFSGKIIAFSSELSPVVAEEYRQLRVDRVLQKPVLPFEFRVILREMFPANYPASLPASQEV